MLKGHLGFRQDRICQVIRIRSCFVHNDPGSNIRDQHGVTPRQNTGVTWTNFSTNGLAWQQDFIRNTHIGERHVTRILSGNAIAQGVARIQIATAIDIDVLDKFFIQSEFGDLSQRRIQHNLTAFGMLFHTGQRNIH